MNRSHTHQADARHTPRRTSSPQFAVHAGAGVRGITIVHEYQPDPARMTAALVYLLTSQPPTQQSETADAQSAAQQREARDKPSQHFHL